MSSPIRNACVARGTAPSTGGVEAFTVPAGYVFLFKQINLRPRTSDPWTPIIYVETPDTFTVVIVTQATSNSQLYFAWEGWIALNAGDKVLVVPNGAQADYWMSGALLPYNPVLQPGAVQLPAPSSPVARPPETLPTLPT